MNVDLKALLTVMNKRAALNKEAFQPPMPAVDPATAGGAPPPMDPSMAGGAPPPMDPSMAGGAPPPPMDPSMAGGAPQVDPAMMQQMMMALQDPNVQQMLAQMGIIVDPNQGPIDQQTGQVIPPDQMLQILQQIMAQMPPPAAAGGAPPPMDPAAMPKEAAMMPGAPMDPTMAGGAPPMDPAAMASPMDPAAAAPPPVEEAPDDLETRVAALEDTVGKLAEKANINPDTMDSVKSEGLTDEAQELLGEDTNLEEQGAEKIASENKKMSKRASVKEDPSYKLTKLISRLRS